MRCVILTALSLLPGLLGLPIWCAGQQAAAIRVAVVDDRGAAVPAARVRVVGMADLLGLPAPNGTFTFKDISPGTYQVSAAYPGFRDKTLSVVVREGQTTDLRIQLEQAPPKASDFRSHETLVNPNLYSKPLKEIGQPALCQEPPPEHTERYRFIWVPTFEHPAFLRIDIDPDGVATLLINVWSGEGGYEWGEPTKTVRKLSREEQSDLFAALADIGFWTLPAQVENPPQLIVLDGTQWLIEGLKDENCHVVTRNSSPLTRLFEDQFLAGVAKLKPYYTPNH